MTRFYTKSRDIAPKIKYGQKEPTIFTKEILRNIFYTVQKSQFHALISQEENNLKI